MTDTEASKPAKTATPEQKAQRQTVRVLARAMARLEIKAGEDKPAPDAMKTLWSAQQKTFTANARKLVKELTKNGVALNYDASKVKPKKGGKKAADEDADA